MKKVRSVSVIIYQNGDSRMELPAGEIYQVELVMPDRVVLRSQAQELYELDLDTFETCFEAAG